MVESICDELLLPDGNLKQTVNLTLQAEKYQLDLYNCIDSVAGWYKYSFERRGELVHRTACFYIPLF
jgi:hypothetical protein